MAQLTTTSVVVIGGSLVGLSTALFLKARNVPVTVIERHTGSMPHPRAIGYTHRTIELYRSINLEDTIFDSVTNENKGGKPRRVKVDSLSGKWHGERHWNNARQNFYSAKEANGAGGGIAISQDRMECILRGQAIKRGIDLRLGCQVALFTQNADSVTVTAVDSSGAILTVEGKYVIACDGAHSGIREALGIQRSGVGYLRTIRSVMFRCPRIDKYLSHGFDQFAYDQLDFAGILTHYMDGRWALMLYQDDPSTATQSPAAQRDLVRRAVGPDEPLTDDDIELVTQGQWEMTGLVAERFGAGRVFLAGDAAHALPPNRGGYGANTGIADGHNIAWKLEAVLSGRARPELLDTYDAERRAVALVRHDQIFARDDYQPLLPAGSPWLEREYALFGDAAMELGQIYRSGGIVGAGAELPEAQKPDEWAGRPGTRAPHVWLESEGKKVSTLDLFGDGWVLLSENEAWAQAAVEAGGGCKFLQIGTSRLQPVGGKDAFRGAYGLGPFGATLVRPDGFIAWMTAGKPGLETGFVEVFKKVSYVV